jgi:hypothetical protein
VVQNFSHLPIYRVIIIGRNFNDEVGVLPPCSEIDITSIARDPGVDLGESDGVPPTGMEYTDAAGLVWSRLGAAAPHRGQLPADMLAKIEKGYHGGGGDFNDTVQSSPNSLVRLRADRRS